MTQLLVGWQNQEGLVLQQLSTLMLAVTAILLLAVSSIAVATPIHPAMRLIGIYGKGHLVMVFRMWLLAMKITL
jgi:hypothetical protein